MTLVPTPPLIYLLLLPAILITLVLVWLSTPSYAEEATLLPYQRLQTELIPIQQVLAEVTANFDGIILEIELEKEETWIYEVKLLTPQGNVLEIDYQANTLERLQINGQQDTPSGQERIHPR